MNKDELLANAQKPAEEAMKLHPFYQGKVEVTLKAAVHDYHDFAVWYTPGVAAPCRAIQARKEEVYRLTNKANFVAIVTDGTRVLGLGDIGPEAALPVMEGKALLFKYLGGVDAFPICLDTQDADELINTVKLLQPSFGGINLEDIASPKCFWPWEAREAGAAVVATGRSDFPNQVNNSLGFPAIFRGVLDVQASTITDTMCITAAKELAACASKKGLNPEKILPVMDDWEVFPRVAAATAMQAIAEGVARLKLDRETVYQAALQKIKRAQEQTKLLMDGGIIPVPAE